MAGLRLGAIPLALGNSGNVPFKFRIENYSVIRARVLHEQQLSPTTIGKDTYSIRVEVVAGSVLASATSAVTVSNRR